MLVPKVVSAGFMLVLNIFLSFILAVNTFERVVAFPNKIRANFKHIYSFSITFAFNSKMRC